MATNLTQPIVGDKTHVPKNDIKTNHKVIRFGTLCRAESEEEQALYEYVHQRADLKVSRGVIPIGFLSCITLQEGHPVYLETRDGGYDERNRPIGPEYQVRWKAEQEIMRIGSNNKEGDGWANNLDEIWTAALSHFERKNLLSEETLDNLDADPFVLFGIDCMISQQALRKLEKCPALMCEGSQPAYDEWAFYMRIDPLDSKLKWLVQAISETDLPKPWTCYKGVGSIVCYIRSDTGQVTWKHPFYDYFRQLRDFCRQASGEEVMQVRCNRLLWSYEASRIETEAQQEPIISPEYIARLSDIFGYNIKTQGCLVRNLKAQLKCFARSYREKQDISMGEVITCAEILQRDADKYVEMVDHWQNKSTEELQFDLFQLANGELQCVNCGKTALSFCLECKDYLCLNCYKILHNRGARLFHAPFRLVPCDLCVEQPAKLHCTFTDKSLCHKCYAMQHIKMLPPDGKENQPRRIDYMQQYRRFADMANDKTGGIAPLALTNEQDAYESVLSTDWHPFYDARGVKFYHNFATSERMRQSPRRVPTTADPGSLERLEAEAEGGADTGLPTSPSAGATQATMLGGGASSASMLRGDSMASVGSMSRMTTTAGGLDPGAFQMTNLSESKPLVLSGFDALKTDTKAANTAASQPELRSLRPPHRKHMPNEVPVL